MQLAIPEGRAVRMLVALLAAADPEGRLERGAGPDAYTPLAWRVLTVLRQGGGRRDVVRLLSPGRDTERQAFAAAACDWWVSSSRVFSLPLAS